MFSARVSDAIGHGSIQNSASNDLESRHIARERVPRWGFNLARKS